MKITYLERTPGHWRIRAEIKGPDGQRQYRYETLKGTRADAEARGEEMRQQWSEDLRPIGATATLEEFWRANVKRRVAMKEIRPTSSTAYITHLNVLSPEMRSTPLARITTAGIEAEMLRMLTEGYSILTVKTTFTTFSATMNEAARQGLLRKNPMLEVRALRRPKGKLTTLNAKSVQAILDVVKDNPHLGAVIRFAVMTGCRRGEICGLKWDDVDLKAGTVSIRQTLVKDANAPGGCVEQEPKTEASYRTITLPEPLREELATRRSYARTDYVFETRDGERRTPQGLSVQINALFKAHGLSGFSLHDLRHAHATLLLGEKFSPKAVSRRLGHSDIVTTLRTYAHVMPGDDAQLAEFTGRAFK